MKDQILQITITERKERKTSLGRWWDRKIVMPFEFFRGKVRAAFWGTLYKGFLALHTKEGRKRLEEEYNEEFEVQIINKTSDEEIQQIVADGLKEIYGDGSEELGKKIEAKYKELLGEQDAE